MIGGWDGYAPARDRLYRHLLDHNIDNVVVLTGDIHSSWGNDLSLNPYDPAVYDPTTGRGSVGVEFVTPGVTSPGIEIQSRRRKARQRCVPSART